MEQVTNYTFVSINMLIPCLLGGLSITFAFGIGLLNIRFFVLLVKIFCHEVKDGVDALLRVMLTIALESYIVLS